MKKKIVYLPQPEPQTHITFRSRAGVTDDILALLHEKGRQYGVESVLPFRTDNIVLAQWVNLKCRYGCSQYNANWSCPPATPDLDQVKRMMKEYSTALLLAGSQNRNDFYKDSNRNRTDQVKYWKGTVSLERMLFLLGYDKAISLVSGACSLCRECAYPKACRFPMEKRPTVESFYIDLVGTLKHLGIETCVAMAHHETFKYYSIILLD